MSLKKIEFILGERKKEKKMKLCSRNCSLP